MENFDWTVAIDINLQVLRFVGLWPKAFELYKPDCYMFYAILVAILIYGGHNLTQIINIFYVYSDLQALTATIFITTTNSLAVMKMCLFVRNLGMIKNLLKTLNTSQFRPRNLRQVRLVRPSLNRWRFLYFLFTAIVFFNLLMWSIGPILNHWTKDYRLQFEAWYPFDIKVSPNYEIAYIYQIVCIWYITSANLNLDTFIIAFMMFIWTQCDLLCNNLMLLEDDEDFGGKLIEYIEHQKAIFRFADEFNKFFNIIILGQFATSTVVLAMTMFQLSITGSNSVEGFTQVCYICGITTEILLYCWFGNEVIIKSSGIAYAVFKSKWIGQPKAVKRNMLILCCRSQRPIRITAINLFNLSLQTFIGIIRSAWSYFALLSSIENSD